MGRSANGDSIPVSSAMNVRVAEALGYKLVPLPVGKIDHCLEGGEEAWLKPDGSVWGCATCSSLPDFYTDWSATGPLIETYAIQLLTFSGKPYDDYRWRANQHPDSLEHGWGAKPLTAVCNLILALKEAGKLNV